MQVSDVRKNFEADLVVVKAHLAWNLVGDSTEQHLLFVSEFVICLPDDTLSEIFTFADIRLV